MYEISTYAQVVGKALAIESAGNQIGQESAGEHGAQAVMPPFIRPRKKKEWGIHSVCARCTRLHLGECQAKTCFLYDMVGHFKKDCPRIRKDEQKGMDSLTPARVFILRRPQTETETSSSGVAG